MSYSAKIIADTLSPAGIRITTFEVTMPKWILAELNTHRMLSRNSASSRAIPTEQIIAQVLANPVVPISFFAKNKGMTATTALEKEVEDQAKLKWINLRLYAIETVEEMMKLPGGIDKQRVNRLLEPWMWGTTIITATEWENFFTLRNSPEAQPEFGYIASLMEQKYLYESPKHDWLHVPYVTQIEIDSGIEYRELMMMSAARCGRVSYYKHGETSTIEKDIARAQSFADNRHWSPLEHTACSGNMVEDRWYGNFYGWKQLRKFYIGESGSARTNTNG